MTAAARELRSKLAEQNGLSERTLRRYVNAYQEKGFEGLKLSERVRYKKEVMPDNYEEILQEAIQLRREVPRRSVEQIIFILASQFYDNQEETIVEDTFHKVILKFGRFDKCYFDNGTQYAAKQLKLSLAKLSIRIAHAPVASGQLKGKIEKFHQVVDDFISETKAKKIRTLEELNYYWSIYLEKYYHNRSHEGIREYYRSLGVSVSEVVRLVSDPIKILKGKKRSMTFKNFICKGVLVFTALLLIGWLGQYIYMVNGEIDWFRLMLVYGVPVGIPHMFIIVPWHWDLSGILGMVALCVIVGGVFGCVIAAGLAVRAIWYIVGYPISRMLASYNGKRM